MSEFNLRVAPRSVQQETLDVLRQAIFMGMFKPGTRLVESQLCTQLGVSRPSLREALRSLEAERLIDILPNRGPFVPEMTWQKAVAIYEMRELLEVEAVGRYTKRIDDAGRETLSEAFAAFADAVESKDSLRMVTAAAEFYATILNGCGNPILEEMHRGLLARVSFLRSRSMSREGRAENSLGEMKAILDAILASDVEAARKAARAHVIAAAQVAQDVIEQTAQVKEAS